VTFADDGQRSSYRTASNDEYGGLRCLAHGLHPQGGIVAVFHWHEEHGPLARRSGIDTFWFRHEGGAVHMRGTFFVDVGPEYGEMRSMAVDGIGSLSSEVSR
jgi:hypothetical protein